MLTTTSPRGTVTRYVWSYNAAQGFPLGRLTEIDEGYGSAAPRHPVTFTYYSSGLVWTITTAQPGYSGAAAPTVTTTYEYDSLSNVTKITTPSNNTTTANIITVLNYLDDGLGHTRMAPLVAQPLQISVQDSSNVVWNVTRFGYDSRGNILGENNREKLGLARFWW